MGMAIIMVMLSHLLSVCKEVKPFWLFYPGFLGVDIFLFLSGYGLCRSWESHTPATFYRRRLWRILPLFLIFQAFTTVSQAASAGNLTWADAACNLTTLSFWHLGGTCSEWYLSFLLYLYLLFPLLYALTRKAGPALLYLHSSSSSYGNGQPTRHGTTTPPSRACPSSRSAYCATKARHPISSSAEPRFPSHSASSPSSSCSSGKGQRNTKSSIWPPLFA